MEPVLFNAVFPIGDTDPTQMPVPDLDVALPYYTNRLRFSLERREESPIRRAVIRRDDVCLGLAETGADPEQASCYISVSDVEAAHAEATRAELKPTALRVDSYEGSRYRVFFIKDDVGLCFCLGQQIQD